MNIGVKILQTTAKAVLIECTDSTLSEETWIPRSQIQSWDLDDTSSGGGRDEIESGDTGILSISDWFARKLL